MLYGNLFKSGSENVKFKVRKAKVNYNFSNVFLTDLQCFTLDFYTSLIKDYQNIMNTEQHFTKTCPCRVFI